MKLSPDIAAITVVNRWASQTGPLSCASNYNNVVVAGIEGFTTVDKPLIFE